MTQKEVIETIKKDGQFKIIDGVNLWFSSDSKSRFVLRNDKGMLIDGWFAQSSIIELINNIRNNNN